MTHIRQLLQEAGRLSSAAHEPDYYYPWDLAVKYGIRKPPHVGNPVLDNALRSFSKHRAAKNALNHAFNESCNVVPSSMEASQEARQRIVAQVGVGLHRYVEDHENKMEDAADTIVNESRKAHGLHNAIEKGLLSGAHWHKYAGDDYIDSSNALKAIGLNDEARKHRDLSDYHYKKANDEVMNNA
jgi:hypothetical protein